MTIGILQSAAEPDAKLFAATTLRGKVGSLNFCSNSQADKLDHLRCSTNTSRCTTSSTKSTSGAAKDLCDRATTDTSSALRLLGYSGYTNDGVEKCGSRHSRSIRD